MTRILRREFIYLWYYTELQLRQIFWYWVLGILIGSLVSVFAKEGIHRLFQRMQGRRIGLFGIVPACLLGIASPLCMYGTIPIAASFSRQGMRDDWLAAFMMASILLNPQLITYSAALGSTVLAVRIVSCFLCGCAAGLCIHLFFRSRSFFDFTGFDGPENHDTHPNPVIRYLLNVWRNIRATGLYFLLGVLLSAV
ncbi:MAG: permease, partial [Oscillospiraceae bacterium]|nr:permease [Oscillospiraceae bacterium]